MSAREPSRTLPSGASISKADVMLARTDKGLCLTVTCLRLADDEDGLCLWCRRAAKER